MCNQPSDVLPEPVRALIAAHPYAAGHMRQVARLALRLFDGLRLLHGMGEGERLLLHCAAQLHDQGVGPFDDNRAHHKVSEQLIRAADLAPLSAREQDLIAQIARYHRKALPRASHARFAALSGEDKLRVRVLAALLRVADGLDRGHRDAVRDVTVETTPETLRLTLDASGPVDEEREAARLKGDLLEEVFARKLVIEVA